MTHTLQDKPSLVTVPFRQVVTKAGEITSTVQDTSTWTPLENGLNIKDGYLALSTVASTTVTNAETLYPQLWANAPTAWRSGSDLIIPAQGNVEVKETIDVSGFANEPYNIGTDIQNILLRRAVGLRVGNTMNLGLELSYDPNFASANYEFRNITIPKSDIPFLNGRTVIRGYGTFWDNRNSGGLGGGRFFADNNDFFIDIIGPQTNVTPRSVIGTMTVFLDEDLSDATPVISLFNNVASSSIGLPQADAEVSGLTTLNQVAEAGRNYIINGGFDFWQRGTSDSSSPTTPTYLSDRWQIERQGDGGVNFLRDSNVPDDSFDYSLRMAHQSVPASSRSGIIWQRISVDEYKHLLGKQVTISWRQAVTHTGGTTSVLVFQNTNVTKDVWGSENSFETQIVNEVIPFAGAGAWEEKSYTFTIPETATTGIVVGFSSFLDNLSTVGSMFITGVKLEEGDKATKFTRAGITYEGELALCQRYFYKMSNDTGGNNYFITPLRFHSLTSLRGTLLVPTQLRDAPSISYTNLVLESGATISSIGAGTSDSGYNHLNFIVSTSTAGSNPQDALYWNNNGFLIFESEL